MGSPIAKVEVRRSEADSERRDLPLGASLHSFMCAGIATPLALNAQTLTAPEGPGSGMRMDDSANAYFDARRNAGKMSQRGQGRVTPAGIVDDGGTGTG